VRDLPGHGAFSAYGRRSQATLRIHVPRRSKTDPNTHRAVRIESQAPAGFLIVETKAEMPRGDVPDDQRFSRVRRGRCSRGF
jgi:hypothetical protein